MVETAALEVLIVDDHEGMRALLRTVLTRAGGKAVREAASGAEGLALLDERAADLILVDHMMPGMDGVAFVARARETGSAARIIMITGHVDPHYAESAHAAGADAVLVKPVAPRELLAAIERVFA